MPYERASHEEQNGTNFSFIAPSSEELRGRLYGSGKGRHTHKYFCVEKGHFSPTVQRNYMKLGVGIAANTVSARLYFGLCT